MFIEKYKHMANNKKVFSIAINGLTESIRSVDALTEKIQNLQKLINSTKKLDIPVEIGGNVEELIKQINSLKGRVTSATKGVLPIADEQAYAKALKDREKALAAVNQELGESGKNLEEYKRETKALVAQEKKARNEAKTYANTLNGLKQALKDLNETKGDIDLNSEEYVEVSEKIYQLTTKLRELEAQQGSFGRNVGNYKSGILDAASAMGQFTEESEKAKVRAQELKEVFEKLSQTAPLDTEDLRNAGLSMREVRDELARVEDELFNKALNDADYKELEEYRDRLKIVSDEMKRFRGEVVKADNQLKTQLQRTINGTTYTWETLNAAVGELEDKLYQLAASGQKNTAEFDAIAQAAAELKMQLRQVDYEIDAMVESSSGIQKMVSYSQGFAAIAQGAASITQLFGIEDEDTLKSMQTLQALQGIAMSLQTVKELANKDNNFGKMMENWNRNLNNILGRFQIFRNEVPKAMEEAKRSIASFNAQFASLNTSMGAYIPDIQSAVVNLNKTLRSDMDALIAKANTLDGVSISTYQELIQLGDELSMIDLSQTTDTQRELIQGISNLQSNATNAAQSVIRLRDAGFGLTGMFANLIGRVKTFINNLRGIKTESIAAGEGAIRLSRNMQMAMLGMKAATTAAKALRAALKALVIFEVINLLFKAVQLLVDFVKWTYQAATGNHKLVNSLSTLEGRLNAAATAMENYNKQLERLNNQGKITDVDKAVLQFEYLEKAIKNAAKELKEFVATRDKWEKKNKDYKSLDENLGSGGLTQWSKFDDIRQFREEYVKLMKAVEANTDVKALDDDAGFWSKLWYTKKDAKSDLGVMQKRVIQDLEHQINNLDLSKGMSEIEGFLSLLEDEMYRTSLDNIENLFPEEEWAQVLKKRIESIRDMYNQIDEAAKNSSDTQIEQQQRVRDNTTEAIKDEQEREIKALRNQMQDEITAAKGDQELILSIRAKYQRLESDMLKKHNKDKLSKMRDYEDKLKDLLRKTRDNYLSTENNSLDKTIEEINNKRKDELEDAKIEAKRLAQDGTNLLDEYRKLEVSINAKYDAEIVRRKKDYYKNLLDQHEKYLLELIKLRQGENSSKLDARSRTIDIEYNEKVNSSSGSFDFNSQYKGRLDAEKAFNKERLRLELEYLNEKNKMDNDYVFFERDDAMSQETQRYEQALKDLKEFKENGYATEAEYNELVEKEEELHQETVKNIQNNAHRQIEANNREHLNNIKETISSSLSDNVSLYQIFNDRVNELLEEAADTSPNIFGVTKYKDIKSKYDEALKAVKEGTEAIDKEIKNLDDQLKNGKITYVDYKDAREQLEDTKKELQKGGKDITKALKDLLSQTATEWKGLIDSWVSQVGSLLSTLNDTKLQLIDNQLDEVDHQLEIAEAAYSAAEEAAEAHKDKMNSIEDELADARGSRRQALVDALAAQQEAYLAELATQKQAEQEKERLEERQKALEKQRREQEKKASVQQAILNTYTAVSNALAVQPWFVGLALSAVALGLGLKNVAAIKATPIYEDGGVIQGARHSQGGVKVLGGQAEVEGGEYITNRKSTAANLPLLEYINSQKRTISADDLVSFFSNGVPRVNSSATRRFANGGKLPIADANEVNRVVQVSEIQQDNTTYVVSVVDIISAQDNLKKIQVLSGLNDN